MTTTGYEVHVIKDRRWIVAERFPNDSREEAIATAKRMFNVDHLDGVRVFTEKFDNATQLFVPQYVMREVRPGVKVARDASVQAPATPPPARRVASAPRAVAAQASSAAGWRPAMSGEMPIAALAGPRGGSISASGGFNPDNYLQAITSGSDPAMSADEASALREAGRRAFETVVLAVGLLMEGVGFAMLLALLDSNNTTWNERPLWVTLAFGLLLGGLLVVVRQINKLRKLGSWLRRNGAQIEAYSLQRPEPIKSRSGFNWRGLYDAIFLNKMPSKWPEPAREPAPPPPVFQAVAEASEPAPAEPELQVAAVDQLTGFIAKYLHGQYFDDAVESLTDEEGRFAAYLYLIGAANACVAAAGAGSRAPGLVISAAIKPLSLSGATLDDFTLRRELFENDPRYAAVIDRGREAMESSLQSHEADRDALDAAVAEWRQRAPLSDSERIYVLAIEASLSMGGTPPEPSAVAHMFEDHRAVVGSVINIYHGRPLGAEGCAAFRAAADITAAAMEIQARRLELSMKEGAAPLDVRTVAIESPLRQFELQSITQLLAGVRALTALAIPGDVLVSEAMRPVLSSLGYVLRDPRAIPTPGGEPIWLAAIEWNGAPQVSADANPVDAGRPAEAHADQPSA